MGIKINLKIKATFQRLGTFNFVSNNQIVDWFICIEQVIYWWEVATMFQVRCRNVSVYWWEVATKFQAGRKINFATVLWKQQGQNLSCRLARTYKLVEAAWTLLQDVPKYSMPSQARAILAHFSM